MNENVWCVRVTVPCYKLGPTVSSMRCHYIHMTNGERVSQLIPFTKQISFGQDWYEDNLTACLVRGCCEI